MITRMFSVYDSKAKAFLPPFFMPVDAVAKRTFSDCANDPRHAFCMHPEDYTLFALGTFDDNNAAVEIFAQAVNLGLASNHKGEYIDPELAQLVPGNRRV